MPERRLLNLLGEKRIIKLDDAQKESKLSNDEFKASIGALKKKAFIELKKEKIIFNANKEEISKRSPEEIFLDALPIKYDSLTPEQTYAFKNLENKKIPAGLNYNCIDHLRCEAKEKFSTFAPASLAQASRISGITPADITVLQIHLKKYC